MKRRTLLAAVALAVALTLAGPLEAGKRKHPSELEYPPLEIETPEVVEMTFDNGMEGFLIEDHEIPVVDIVILFRTYFPAEDKYGLSEMAQWVIRNGGSEGWPADSLNDELEFLAASVEVYGGDLNTVVYMNCLKKDLDRVAGMTADLIMNPLLPREKIDKKAGDMIEEIRRQNDQPSAIARREFFELVYAGHPYGWDTTEESVTAITRDDLVDFHGKWFHPNNAIVGISGDIDEAEAEALMARIFDGWEPADAVVPKVPEIVPVFEENWNYAYKDINQAYMMVGHLGINSKNEDRCAVEIMNFILGGGSFTSWITTEVREKRGLAYSSGARFGTDAFAVGAFYAYAQTKAEEYSRALQLIIDQIEKMKTTGPEEEELEKAVDSFLNSHVFDYDSKSGMVRRLVQLKFQGRPLDTPERDMERYEELTVEDIKRVAGKYLHPEGLTILVVGDRERFDKDLGEFGEVNVIELEK